MDIAYNSDRSATLGDRVESTPLCGSAEIKLKVLTFRQPHMEGLSLLMDKEAGHAAYNILQAICSECRLYKYAVAHCYYFSSLSPTQT
jgi:hypothetical protein